MNLQLLLFARNLFRKLLITKFASWIWERHTKVPLTLFKISKSLGFYKSGHLNLCFNKIFSFLQLDFCRKYHIDPHLYAPSSVLPCNFMFWWINLWFWFEHLLIAILESNKEITNKISNDVTRPNNRLSIHLDLRGEIFFDFVKNA